MYVLQTQQWFHMKQLHTDSSKVAKQILPAGFNDYTYGKEPNFYWRKAHGHAGRGMIERTLDKAKALGFKPGPYGCFNSPDGNVMGSQGKYHHSDGWELEFCMSYGVVAYDNSFSMTLKKVA